MGVCMSPRSVAFVYQEKCAWMTLRITEMGLVTVMGYNILEASYAIKYPRAPPPVPFKSSKTPISSPVSQSKSPRPFQVLSPNSSPQPQRPFTFNPSASTSSPLANSTSSRGLKKSVAASTSTAAAANANGSANNNSSTANPPYAQSPVSTPSRVLHYTVPPSASTASNVSAASTSSEYLATPSPMVSAYRGKHISGEVGREFSLCFILFPNILLTTR